MISSAKLAVAALAACVAAAAAAALARPAAAQAGYPSQPVKMLVGNTAGSASDTLGRILAGRLSQHLGVQFLVVNQPGAGGTIAAEAVARAAPDGYTLYITSTQAHAIAPHLYPKAKYKPLDDFVAVTMVARTENLLVLPAGSPFTSLAQVLAHAKANPGKLTMANAGPGSQSHLSGAMLTSLAGIDVLHVPYKGAASVTAVAGAQNDMTIAPMPAVIGLVNGGKLRAIAVAGATRSKLQPGLPTIAESGVAGFASTGWTGVVAPKGTPQVVIDKLRAGLISTVEEPAVADALMSAGGEPWTTSQADMARFMADDLARFGEAVRITGAKVE